MAIRLILIALAVIVLILGGLVWFGYSTEPDSKPVQVELPDDQFPQ